MFYKKIIRRIRKNFRFFSFPEKSAVCLRIEIPGLLLLRHGQFNLRYL